MPHTRIPAAAPDLRDRAPDPIEPLAIYGADQVGKHALADLVRSFASPRLWLALAWNDIRQRFRRSLIGPFWLVISNAVYVAAMAMVFGGLFRHPLDRFLPYLAIGVVTWSLISVTILEGTMALIQAESFIKNTALPILIHVFRAVSRNLIVWGISMTVFFGISLVFPVHIGLVTLQLLFGIVLLSANLFWIAMICSIVASRYRDFYQIVASVMQVMMFLTPIFWSPLDFPTRPFFVDLNPFYHLLELIRLPLLGEWVPPLTWVIALAMAFVGTSCAAWLYSRTYAKIAYWV